jgi:lysophospholipase L1-like esterase
MLPALFDDQVVVANHARSGATLKSFLTSRRLAKVLEQIDKGDWLFIQFGHNDQKKQWSQTYADPRFAFPAYLRAYIAEALARGARPVLVTPPERGNFDGEGRIKDSLGEYARAVRAIANEQGVPLIDLNRDSIAIYQALGPAAAPAAFALPQGKDRTHHDRYGAWLMANAVGWEVRAGIPDLGAHLNARPFDPDHPPGTAEIEIDATSATGGDRPAGS